MQMARRSLCRIHGAFGIGNLTQGNAAAEQLHHAFAIPSWGTAAVLTILTALVMLGGIRSIAKVCAFFVPFMAVIYIIGCVYILAVQSHYILPAIRYILDCAFTGEAAAGGVVGAAVMTAMRTGVARGLFSNEAGLGTATPYGRRSSLPADRSGIPWSSAHSRALC